MLGKPGSRARFTDGHLPLLSVLNRLIMPNIERELRSPVETCSFYPGITMAAGAERSREYSFERLRRINYGYVDLGYAVRAA